MEKPKLPEPWLRGTLTDVPPVQRAILHALELAKEDLERWCADLSDDQLNARPAEIAPVAFHIRHIMDPGATRDQVFAEFNRALQDAVARVQAFSPDDFSHPRSIGRQQLPTTLGGLLVHVADHTQRHVGQAITTAKIVLQHP